MGQIRGLFPLPPQQVGQGGALTLGSGGIYVLPAGNWLLNLGEQTTIQWYDGTAQQWRFLLDSDNFVQIGADGANYRLINLSGVVVGANITAVGSGATNGIGSVITGVTVTFAASPGPAGAPGTATGYAIVGGSVAAPTITQGGSGFTVPPLILIDPPPFGGIQATAVATISAAGVITAITMVNVGAGYLVGSVPNFYIVPQTLSYAGGPTGGIAAAAYPPVGLVHPNNALPGGQNQPNISTAGALLTPVALTGSGTLTGIGMNYYGAGYTGTTIPAVTITGAGGAAATAVMSMCVTSITLGAGGGGYGAGNPPLWESSLGLVVSNSFNGELSPVPAMGVTTVAAGAVNAFVIEDNGFGFQKVPVIGVINTSAIATTTATATAVCGGVNDTSILQSAVQ